MSELGRALPELVPIPSRFDVAESASTTDSGTLIRASERSTGRTVGIRRLSLEFTTDPRALSRLLELAHPNLLPVREVLRDTTGIYLITDWAERGTLADQLASGYPDAMVLHRVVRGVSRALDHLHQRNIAPARLEASQILENEAGLFQVAGYGVPEQSGEETSFNPSQEDSGSGADRFQVDLLAFAALIDTLRDELPAPLRSICARCAPDANGAFQSAAELSLAIEQLPEVVALPEFDSKRASKRASSSAGGAGGSAPRSGSDPGRRNEDRGDTTEEPFPWRPMEELYRLEGSAMKGGMGSVWMATELATRRKVAIKRLHKQEALGSNMLTRFYREAQSIANLSHPHILQLLQPARDAQGDYLVLEWAAGGSLRERLSASGPLPPNEVLDIARKIGGALAYAHSKGVIHRDIKPHNILLTETGEPKLADFGLARSMGDATLSSSRGGAGSPMYMPPEQYDDTHKSDARSDIYSLGKTLYQLLTNKSPAAPLPELLPRQFRTAVFRCMESEPDARPASIDEFLSELGRERTSPLLPFLMVAVVLLAAAWIYSLSDGEKPGDPAPTSTEVVAGDRQPSSAGGPALLDAAQVLLAGLFTSNGGQALAKGQKTDQDRVEIRLRFDPPVTDTHPEIVVRRGGLRLDPEDLQIVWGEAGVVTVSVPLVGRENQFEVEVPDRKFQSDALAVVRMDPEPVLRSVSESTRIETAKDLWLTRSKTVQVQLDVARAAGIGKLWIDQNDARSSVTIEASRIVKSVELSEGDNEFRWFWPDPTSPLKSGRFRIKADFTAPVIALQRPAPGLLTNLSTLPLKGQLTDTNLGREVSWKLTQNGQLVTQGSPATEANGSFSDEAQVPDGRDGALSLEFNAVDQAGNPAETLRLDFRVDRQAPELSAAPRFTPDWDVDHALIAVALSGRASEPLMSARVNDRPAELISADEFRLAGLKVEQGEAYSVVLFDEAGNQSAPTHFAHGIDSLPPTASLRFVERDGQVQLSITPSEPLAGLSVDGEPIDTELLSTPSIQAPVSGSHSDRITWKPVGGQPVSGPTNAPIELGLTDGSGNRTTLWLVICPEDGVTAIRCIVNAEGEIAGTEPCPECSGRYCPRTGTRGKHQDAGEWPEDYWLRFSEKQCGYCGWRKP